MDIDKHQAFNLAQNQQPEYLATLLGSQQADLNLVMAKDSGRWQVDLVAGANQLRDASNNDFGNTNNRHWDSYTAIQVQIPIGDISTRQAEVRARIERDKLSTGRSTNFQVLSFEADLRNAENSRLNALIAYLNAQTQLELTLGMTLESWEIALNDY